MKRIFIFLFALFCLASTANAAGTTYTATVAGNFSDASVWTPEGGPPGAEDTAVTSGVNLVLTTSTSIGTWSMTGGVANYMTATAGTIRFTATFDGGPGDSCEFRLNTTAGATLTVTCRSMSNGTIAATGTGTCNLYGAIGSVKGEQSGILNSYATTNTQFWSTSTFTGTATITGTTTSSTRLIYNEGTGHIIYNPTGSLSSLTDEAIYTEGGTIDWTSTAVITSTGAVAGAIHQIGGTVNCASPMVVSGSAAVYKTSGTLNLTGTSLTHTGNGSAFDLSGGTLACSSILNLSGSQAVKLSAGTCTLSGTGSITSTNTLVEAIAITGTATLVCNAALIDTGSSAITMTAGAAYLNGGITGGGTKPTVLLNGAGTPVYFSSTGTLTSSASAPAISHVTTGATAGTSTAYINGSLVTSGTGRDVVYSGSYGITVVTGTYTNTYTGNNISGIYHTANNRALTVITGTARYTDTVNTNYVGNMSSATGGTIIFGSDVIGMATYAVNNAGGLIAVLGNITGGVNNTGGVLLTGGSVSTTNWVNQGVWMTIGTYAGTLPTTTGGTTPGRLIQIPGLTDVRSTKKILSSPLGALDISNYLPAANLGTYHGTLQIMEIGGN